MVENPSANAGDIGSIPDLERAPGEGNGYLLQYSCLGNPVDRGAWRAKSGESCASILILCRLSNCRMFSSPQEGVWACGLLLLPSLLPAPRSRSSTFFLCGCASSGHITFYSVSELLSFFLKLSICLFTWLCRPLVVACRIFTCGMWDLVT